MRVHAWLTTLLIGCGNYSSLEDASGDLEDTSSAADAGRTPHGLSNSADQRSTRACAPSPPLAGALARYDFEGLPLNGAGVVTDSVGTHHGSLVGGDIELVPGPDGCGQALRFTESNAASYIEIPDHADFVLQAGSIDLWYRHDAREARLSGIVSRAELDSSPFFELVTPPRPTVAFVFNGDVVYEVESDTLPERWVHIGLNFGPPALELYLDGELLRRSEAGSPDLSRDSAQSAWRFGVSPRAAGELVPLRSAAIDGVRFSRERRDFSR